MTVSSPDFVKSNIFLLLPLTTSNVIFPSCELFNALFNPEKPLTSCVFTLTISSPLLSPIESARLSLFMPSIFDVAQESPIISLATADGITFKSILSLSRRTVIISSLPKLPPSISLKSFSVLIFLPLTAITLSPTCRPAFWAGESESSIAYILYTSKLFAGAIPIRWTPPL